MSYAAAQEKIAQAQAEGWTELDLAGLELETLPPELWELEQLETLILGKYDDDAETWVGNQLVTLPHDLTRLNNLKELSLVDNRFSEVPETVFLLDKLRKLKLDNNNLSSLPVDLERLTELEDLGLGYNQFEAVPIVVQTFKKLKYLSLTKNSITDLPIWLQDFSDLAALALGGNRLQGFPRMILNLNKLEKLWLWGCPMQGLPPEIVHLTNLQTLNLSWNQLSSLPEAIGKLTNLQKLDLGGNELSSLPEAIGNLTNLQELNLWKNQLSSLPEAIVHLANLQELDLSNNQLRSLPEAIVHLANLQTLYLSWNQLRSLPEAIVHLTNLQSLYLFKNQLSSLPEAIGNLTNLQKLFLWENQLSSLPEAIGNLTNLQTLNLRENQLSSLPEAIGNLTNLQSLGLGGNQLSSLPEAIGNLTNLQELYLSSNQLSSLPEAIGNLTNLQELSLSSNQLNSLPEAIGNLTNLQELSLSSNQLSSLPEAIVHLTNLQTLDLSENQLRSLPDAIVHLTNLQSLDLSFNQLRSLPDAIVHLTNLRSLDLSFNQLRSLPDAIVHLTNLRSLYLSGNQLSSLPEAIGNLTNLQELDLENNESLIILPHSLRKLEKLKKLNLIGCGLPIPQEILGADRWKLGDPAQILEYYFRLQDAKQRKPLNECKLLLVGQGKVGKTSIVKRLLDQTFNPQELKTDGIAIRTWLLPVNDPKGEEQEVRLNVWDFGGQEIMHATHQFFLTKRSVYLLVLDARLDEGENRLEYWLKIIQSFGEDSPVIVVGNQVDEHPLDLDRKGYRAKYPQIQAFVETSCKTNIGFDSLKKVIREQIAQMPEVFEPLPLDWFQVKAHLENIEQDYIEYHHYGQICAQQAVTETISQETLLTLLHRLGIVLAFQEHERLRNTHVLNPEWVTQGVYKILNDNRLMTDFKGVLKRAELGRILNNQIYPQNKWGFLIDLMAKFELCFPLEDGSETGSPSLLIPDLLPKEEPDTGDWTDSLQFQYHYPVLPSSVISRFIVRMKGLISKKTYWRTGVVLAQDRNRALVKADLYDAKIFIFISGNPATRRHLLSAIRAQFTTLNQDLKGIASEIIEKVPIPNHPHILVDYPHLLDLEELGEETFIPSGLKQKVSVQDLLNGIEPLESRYRSHRYPKDSPNMSTDPTPNIPTDPNPNPPPSQGSKGSNPWISGSFYLVLAVVVMTLFAVIGSNVPPYVFVIVVIGGILAIIVVGSFQLRQDDRFSEANFLTLVQETLKRLPLIRKGPR